MLGFDAVAPGGDEIVSTSDWRARGGSLARVKMEAMGAGGVVRVGRAPGRVASCELRVAS